MLKFAANLSFLFQEVDFPARFERAANAGFQGVEYLFPYEWPADQLVNWLSSNGLEQVLFNLSPGDWAAGERGMACHPGREAAFRQTVLQALGYAEKLGCKRLHAMSGLRVPNISEEEHEDVFLENLHWAADQCAAAGITLLIEPINCLIDMPRYWLDTPAKAFALQSKLNHPALKVQLDLYHAQVVGENLSGLIEKHFSEIGHLQLADVPGRHEPGSGNIDFPALFSTLNTLNYAGWIGCEYRPRVSTEASLAWLHAI